MHDTLAQRKARGAYFTPPAITTFIASWAVRTAKDRILEPSCGEADFLLAAGSRLRALGAGLFAGEELHGVEVHEPSARIAEARMRAAGLVANIRVANFFDLAPVETYDAVIGNPPYIRYQAFSGEARVKALRAALRAGVRLNGLASSWAAFVIHATSFLREGGRLGLVLPAELLTVKYASQVRRFLLQRFGSVKLVMFDELVFPNVQEEVVLLLAEGTGPAPHFEVYQARDASELTTVDRAHWVPYAPDADDKWIPAVLDSVSMEMYLTIAGSNGFEPLADWGDIYLGCVTGNNGYFTLTRTDVFELRIPPEELVPISPPGSRHLRDLSFTGEAWERLCREGRQCYMLLPDTASPSPEALQYIWAGEKVGVHKAYKCRIRSPWWRVPIVPIADLFMTYMDRDRPRLITNAARVHHLNSIYGVTLKPDRRDVGINLLPIAVINSVTLLGAELVGRAYGGGLLKLEPREADRLPVPSVALVEAAAEGLRGIRLEVSAALMGGNLQKAVHLVDQVLLVEQLGLAQRQIDTIWRGREALFRRRALRASKSK